MGNMQVANVPHKGNLEMTEITVQLCINNNFITVP